MKKRRRKFLTPLKRTFDYTVFARTEETTMKEVFKEINDAQTRRGELIEAGWETVWITRRKRKEAEVAEQRNPTNNNPH